MYWMKWDEVIHSVYESTTNTQGNMQAKRKTFASRHLPKAPELPRKGKKLEDVVPTPEGHSLACHCSERTGTSRVADLPPSCTQPSNSSDPLNSIRPNVPILAASWSGGLLTGARGIRYVESAAACTIWDILVLMSSGASGRPWRKFNGVFDQPGEIMRKATLRATRHDRGTNWNLSWSAFFVSTQVLLQLPETSNFRL